MHVQAKLRPEPTNAISNYSSVLCSYELHSYMVTTILMFLAVLCLAISEPVIVAGGLYLAHPGVNKDIRKRLFVPQEAV